jgi:hypothetical protein
MLFLDPVDDVRLGVVQIKHQIPLHGFLAQRAPVLVGHFSLYFF